MDNEETSGDVERIQNSWDRFVEKAKESIDSGELIRDEIEYKLEIACKVAAAREAVLFGIGSWSDSLKKALSPQQPIDYRPLDNLNEWCKNDPANSLKAMQAIWTPESLSDAERIRAFSRHFPQKVVSGKESRGTRTTVISALLMGLDVERFPPFRITLFEEAYRQTGYPMPETNEDEAVLYEHALGFLDHFIREAREHGVHLRHRLDAQSLIWRSQRKDDPFDLPKLSQPFHDFGNEARPEDDYDGWEEFVRRAEELLNSDKFRIKNINPLLDTGRKLADARTAVIENKEQWANLAKHGFGRAPVFTLKKRSFLDWIDTSRNDSVEALKAIWRGEDSQLEQRIGEFCKRFPEEVLSGTGTRTTIAAALLMALDAEKYTPFSIKKLQHACRQTGYEAPESKADEAALYAHLLRFLDQLKKEAKDHGLNLNNRLETFAVVWHLVDELPRLASQSPETRTLKALSEDLLLDMKFLEEIEALLEDKGQVIFQGPPGTGKTYIAQALAKHYAETVERVTLVQFHPSYAYEDFVRGFRPTLKDGQAGFALQDGPLLRAAQKAREEPDAKHFLIIDEINRGNLAKVFGELYFLLEYRDEKIRMQYQRDDEDNFSLPENLYIIGTMNTADRSIALVDLALRRRFYFIEFHPDKEPVKGVLRKWLSKSPPDLEWVADVVEEANRQLEEYKHAAIGPSYFMRDSLRKEDVPRIWKHSVLPYIEELLFGDEAKIKQLQLKALCQKVAPSITWDEDDEQEDDEPTNNSEVVNDETDQPSGVPGEQSNPS